MKLHRDHRPQPSADLRPAQQTVTRTRDVEGYSAEKTRRLLHVSDGNQRVLVRRERPRVRSVLETHLDGYAHERISCQQVVELVTDYLEGSLATKGTALFEQHLNFCDGCEWYLDQMRSTVAAVRRIEETDVPPAMRERLLVAFRDRTRS